MRIQKASADPAENVQAEISQTSIPKTIRCPKCGESNPFFDMSCSYCGYKFKEKDYFDAYSGASAGGKASRWSGGRLWCGLLLTAGGIASCIYGVLLHQDLNAPWASLFSMDAGTAWIFLGAAAAIAGLLLCAAAFFRRK